MSKSPATERAFVLGLDGVPWEKLRTWAIDGELPAFQRLFETGAAGPLLSTMPPSTPLAWPSITTGTWPDRHGVYAFQKLRSDYTHRMYTSRDVDQPSLWDVLSPSVVANVPMTFPASEIDGTMITGFLNNEPGDGFTHPPEFKDELLEAIPDYRIGLDWSEYRSQPGALQEPLDHLVTVRESLLKELMTIDDWRLFFFTFTAPDRLQHLIWDEDVLLAHYQRLDEILANVMEYVSENEGSLFVVSDHGFGPIDKRVNVNTVLEQAGYLGRKETNGLRRILDRIGFDRDRLLQVLGAVGVSAETIANRLPERLVDTVAENTPGEHGLYDVDFTETEAFVHGIASVYVNDTDRFDHGIVPSSEIDRVKSEIQVVFEDLTDPTTGEQVFTVHDGAELFSRDPWAPDLVLDSDRYTARTALEDDLFTDCDGLVADHRSEGLFMAWGPDIAAGTRVDVTVVDVLPTVLHTVGEPVPVDIDGQVVKGLYAKDSAPANDPIERYDYEERTGTEPTHENFDDVTERLQGLGYME